VHVIVFVITKVLGFGLAVTAAEYGRDAAVDRFDPVTAVIFCDETVHHDGTVTVSSPTVTL
jgi:hypothetical protein